MDINNGKVYLYPYILPLELINFASITSLLSKKTSLKAEYCRICLSSFLKLFYALYLINFNNINFT